MEGANDAIFLQKIAEGSIRIENNKVINNGRTLKGLLIRGKHYFQIIIDNKIKTISSCRLFWLAAGKEIPNDSVPILIDVDKSLSLNNIKLISYKDRFKQTHQFVDLSKRNEELRVLTNDDVNWMRKVLKEPTFPTLKYLANKFGVSKTTIHFAISGITFKDCKEPPVNKGRKQTQRALYFRVKSEFRKIPETLTTKGLVAKYFKPNLSNKQIHARIKRDGYLLSDKTVDFCIHVLKKEVNLRVK